MTFSRSLLVFTVVFALIGCSDIVTSHYPTRADAEADSLFERGWLPNIIPPSSHEITTKNDLDFNVSEGEFFFDPNDSENFIRHLSGGTDNGTVSYSYTRANSTWIFDLDAKNGHCTYSMIFKRPIKSEEDGSGQPAARSELK